MFPRVGLADTEPGAGQRLERRRHVHRPRQRKGDLPCAVSAHEPIAFPSLGRNFTNVPPTVELMPAGSLYGGRIYQTGIRFQPHFPQRPDGWLGEVLVRHAEPAGTTE